MDLKKVQAVKPAKEIGQAKAAKELGFPKNTMYGRVRVNRPWKRLASVIILGADQSSSQTFRLILHSDNYTAVNVRVTVYNDTVAVTGAKLRDGKTGFPNGTALSEIVDLSGCSATVNTISTKGTFELMDPGQKCSCAVK